LTFVLTRRRFVTNLIIFEITSYFILIFVVFLIEFEVVILLALLVANSILINALYKFLCKAIEIKRAIESSKSNISNKIAR